MDLFEYDKKAKDIMNKYFSEPGKSEFKVSIFLPKDQEERTRLIEDFSKEIQDSYSELT